MPLWGKSATAATNKPKWCPDDTNSSYDVTEVYANNSGWVRKAGTAATGNGNTSADPEILVAIRVRHNFSIIPQKSLELMKY